jgi:hypothetical protein
MTEPRISNPPSSHRYDDRGASLILALVFIVVVAVIVGAISTLTLNDLNNTGHFDTASAQAYSASGVANVAIQTVRYAPQSSGALGTCWGTTPSEWTFNKVQVEIWCQTTVNGGSSQSRVVTMYACNITNVAITASGCQSKPLLTVVEAYDDYSTYGTDTCSPTNAGSSTCGFGATTLAWTWGSIATATGGQSLNAITITSAAPTPPTHVGATYTPSASATSGDQVTITVASVSTSVCTISNGVVSFIATGSCSVNFDDPGNFNYAPAPEQTQVITVS